MPPLLVRLNGALLVLVLLVACGSLLLLGEPGRNPVRDQFDTASLRFAVIGDWGVPRSPWETAKLHMVPNQHAVAAVMGQWAAVAQPSFVLSTGDAAYPVGLRGPNETSRLQAAWADVYTGGNLGKVPWYNTEGNHDCAGDVAAQRAFGQTEPRWRMGPGFQQSEWAVPGSYHDTTVRLMVLDMCTMACGRPGPPNFRCAASANMGAVRTDTVQARAAMLVDLQRGLHGCGRDEGSWVWCVVAGHWPIFSFGGNGPTAELIEDVLPILRKGGAHAYFSGHDHNLQHIELNDRGDGGAFGAGVQLQLFVSGAGGYTLHPELKDEVPMDLRATQENMAVGRAKHVRHGFLAVTVDDKKIRVQLMALEQQASEGQQEATVVYQTDVRWHTTLPEGSS